MALHKNFINGEWVAGTGAKENINPSDVTDIVGEYAQADKAQTEAAIAAAQAAAPAGLQQHRSNGLIFWKRRALSCWRGGKKLAGCCRAKKESRWPTALPRPCAPRRFSSFLPRRRCASKAFPVASVRAGVDVAITREPLGVVGLICPWNFPIAIPAWKMAPALAFGNTVVFKPADLVPGTAWALVEILSRAGLPKGVLNLVMGRGSVVGQTMLDSRGVNAISFTGSVETGAKVAMACSGRGAKYQLEMGGKNPLVVLDDANIDAAVAASIDGAFYQTGQRCTASSRLVVQSKIHDAFVDKMVTAMKALKVDNALKDGTQVGPVVDENQMAQDEKYIGIARNEGGELAWGGERLNRDTKGHYLSPALFTNTKNEMRINREEVFGPVASVIKVGSYDEALAVANDTAFGLSSGIFTTSLKYATDFRKKSAAGMVMVNLPTAGVDYHVPFGGRKGSSYGAREQGRFAADFYTAIKTAYTLAG